MCAEHLNVNYYLFLMDFGEISYVKFLSKNACDKSQFLYFSLKKHDYPEQLHYQLILFEGHHHVMIL